MNVVSVAALAALFAVPAGAQDAPYRSALDNYQSFKDAELAPWKDANDTVRQIGGWRAYAREAAQGTAAPATPTAARLAPAEGASSPAASTQVAPRLPTPPAGEVRAPVSRADGASAPAAGAHKH